MNSEFLFIKDRAVEGKQAAHVNVRTAVRRGLAGETCVRCTLVRDKDLIERIQARGRLLTAGVGCLAEHSRSSRNFSLLGELARRVGWGFDGAQGQRLHCGRLEGGYCGRALGNLLGSVEGGRASLNRTAQRRVSRRSVVGVHVMRGRTSHGGGMRLGVAVALRV